MPGITLEQAQDQLTQALDALTSARQMQDYQISSSTGGRRVTRASLESLSADLRYWQQQVNRLSRCGGLSSASAVPCD